MINTKKTPAQEKIKTLFYPNGYKLYYLCFNNHAAETLVKNAVMEFNLMDKLVCDFETHQNGMNLDQLFDRSFINKQQLILWKPFASGEPVTILKEIALRSRGVTWIVDRLEYFDASHYWVDVIRVIDANLDYEEDILEI